MVRTDFVSNSSSTSFAIIGYCTNCEDVLEHIKELVPNYDPEKDEEYGSSTYELAQKLIDIIKNRDPTLDIHYECEISEDPYGVYFGLYYDNMKNTETKKHFEERVFEEVKKLFPEVQQHDIEFYTDGGYNG